MDKLRHLLDRLWKLRHEGGHDAEIYDALEELRECVRSNRDSALELCEELAFKLLTLIEVLRK